MKIGVFVFATEYSTDPAILAQRAEALGFASLWVPEHTVMPVHYRSRYPSSAGGKERDAHYARLLARTFAGRPDSYDRILDPFVALARASAVTQRIELGTSICLVPEHNPLLLAKRVATLDACSGGRFVFGIGAGWLREEAELMGADFPRRWTQTGDAVRAMQQLWTQEESSYAGRYYRFPALRSFPKPARKPHPPVLLGSMDARVFQRIVDWGDGWIPARVTVEEIAAGRTALNTLAERAGRDPQTLTIVAFGMPGEFRTAEELTALERAGADQATIWLTQTEGDAALAELEALAATLVS